MNSINIFQIVSYVLGSAFLVMGIIALIGWFIPPYIPDNFRLILGALMILWGIYRIAITRYKAQQLSRHEDLD